MSLFRKLFIWGSNSDEEAYVTNNALDVNIQDQHTELIDLYMINPAGTTNPSTSYAIDATSIDVADSSAAKVGEMININENGRIYQAEVLSISSKTIGLDSPLDMAITTSAQVTFGAKDMSVDGSGTNQIFYIQPPLGVKWDVVRIIVGMLSTTAMDDGKFGGITALTNGVVLRSINGDTKNVFNAKTNGDFRNEAYDVDYASKAPAGQYGIGVRRTFGGKNKNGVVIRLDGTTDDKLEFIIQDDLTSLSSFVCVVQGHTVE